MLLAWGACLCGCFGGPDRVKAPKWDPKSAAQGALDLYDKNGDGYLAADELAACPALGKSLPLIDADPDGRLSADEIAARIERYQKGRIGRMTVACMVLMGGQGVPGATVTFEPEPFLADVIQPAQGVTNNIGQARLAMEGSSPPTMTEGLYKVRISRSSGGRETIPARYNSQTTLGQEIALELPELSTGIRFDVAAR